MNSMTHKTTLIKKVIAGILVCTFACLDLAHAAQTLPMGGSASQGSKATPFNQIIRDPSKLNIPFENATLKAVHQGTNGKLIIHIQDAHANLSGQQSLAKILDHFMKAYDIPLVLVEGGDRDVTLDEVKQIASKSEWKSIAKGFLFEGVISGEEYLNLTSDHPMKLMGIEYPDLYSQNLEAYAELTDKRKKILLYLHKIQSSLNRIKNKLYPKVLTEYEFKREGRDFVRGFDELFKLAQSRSISEAGGSFSEIKKLKAIQQQEKNLDFDLANRDQTRLFEALSQKGVSKELQEYLKASKKLQDSQVSQYMLLNQIFELADSRGISTEGFIELTKYAEYLKAFKELKLDVLLEQIEVFENQVYTSLLSDEDAYKVRAIDRYLKLLKNAYNIQMSSREFDMLKANQPVFDTASWLAFMNHQLKGLGYLEDFVPYMPYLEEAHKSLSLFYSIVNQRDDAFLENADRIMAQHNQDAAFLIAGGYHTQHLTELLREQGFSYVVLAPAVTFETNHKKYEKRLLESFKQTRQSQDTVRELASLLSIDFWLSQRDADSARLRKLAPPRLASTAIASRNNRVVNGASRDPKKARQFKVAGTRRVQRYELALSIDRAKNIDAAFIKDLETARSSARSLYPMYAAFFWQRRQLNRLIDAFESRFNTMVAKITAESRTTEMNAHLASIVELRRELADEFRRLTRVDFNTSAGDNHLLKLTSATLIKKESTLFYRLDVLRMVIAIRDAKRDNIERFRDNLKEEIDSWIRKTFGISYKISTPDAVRIGESRGYGLEIESNFRPVDRITKLFLYNVQIATSTSEAGFSTVFDVSATDKTIAVDGANESQLEVYEHTIRNLGEKLRVQSIMRPSRLATPPSRAAIAMNAVGLSVFAALMFLFGVYIHARIAHDQEMLVKAQQEARRALVEASTRVLDTDEIAEKTFQEVLEYQNIALKQGTAREDVIKNSKKVVQLADEIETKHPKWFERAQRQERQLAQTRDPYPYSFGGYDQDPTLRRKRVKDFYDIHREIYRLGTVYLIRTRALVTLINLSEGQQRDQYVKDLKRAYEELAPFRHAQMFSHRGLSLSPVLINTPDSRPWLKDDTDFQESQDSLRKDVFNKLRQSTDYYILFNSYNGSRGSGRTLDPAGTRKVTSPSATTVVVSRPDLNLLQRFESRGGTSIFPRLATSSAKPEELLAADLQNVPRAVNIPGFNVPWAFTNDDFVFISKSDNGNWLATGDDQVAHPVQLESSQSTRPADTALGTVEPKLGMALKIRLMLQRITLLIRTFFSHNRERTGETLVMSVDGLGGEKGFVRVLSGFHKMFQKRGISLSFTSMDTQKGGAFLDLVAQEGLPVVDFRTVKNAALIMPDDAITEGLRLPANSNLSLVPYKPYKVQNGTAQIPKFTKTFFMGLNLRAIERQDGGAIKIDASFLNSIRRAHPELRDSQIRLHLNILSRVEVVTRQVVESSQAIPFGTRPMVLEFLHQFLQGLNTLLRAA
jgi:hypothetical protein